jgi:ribosomal protein S18 acetylase RimI-like enzyme
VLKVNKRFFNISPPKDLNEIEDLFLRNEYLCSLFRYNSDFSSFLQRENEVRRVLSLVKESDFCRFLTEADKIIGMLIADKSHFDSDLFGFGVGKIRYIVFSDGVYAEETLSPRISLVQKCSSWIRQNNLKCVIARVNPSDSIVFEKNDFHLVDVLLTFHLDRNSIESNHNSSLNNNIEIRLFHGRDETKLMDIARKAFSYDHFHRDKNFPKDKCDELFARWISNCCHGRADCVLVACIPGEKPVGFITCKLEMLGEFKRGIIDLIAVSPVYRRKGIGQYLVLEAIRWLIDNGAQSVIVSTQADNVAAVNTYRKIGFRLVGKQLTFHKWMDK